jgi:adenosylcobyric acid synthase
LFADDRQRAAWLARFSAGATNVAYETMVERTLNALGDHLAAHIDIDRLLKAAR